MDMLIRQWSQENFVNLLEIARTASDNLTKMNWKSLHSEKKSNCKNNNDDHDVIYGKK